MYFRFSLYLFPSSTALISPDFEKAAPFFLSVPENVQKREGSKPETMKKPSFPFLAAS